MTEQDKATTRPNSPFRGKNGRLLTDGERIAFYFSNLPSTPSGCMDWQWGRTGEGYGRLRFQGRPFQAHRVAYILRHGPIPDGASVLHSCDNRVCCNPDHLFLGSHQDNMTDMRRKGRARGARGERQHTARLTAADVLDIREKFAAGVRIIDIARQRGLHKSHVGQIVHRDIWKHI